MKLITWSLSDVGRKRDHNEDSFLVDERLALFAVADGMGGHQGGDHASRMAVEVLRREVTGAGEFDSAAKKLLAEDPTLLQAVADLQREAVETSDTIPPIRGGAVREGAERPQSIIRDNKVARSGGDGKKADEKPDSETKDAIPSTETTKTIPPASDTPSTDLLAAGHPAAATVLRAAARVAGRAIYDAAQADPRLAGMGTTLTAMLFHRDRVHLAHVGDSRAFLFRDGRIEQVTEDHSWIAEQVKAGVMTEAEAKESKFRHIITRSVGFEREVDVDLLGVPALPGDCFVLCSDGMSNYVETEELGRILAANYYRKVPQLLVDIANDRGGDDNITVVLVYVANDKG